MAPDVTVTTSKLTSHRDQRLKRQVGRKGGLSQVGTGKETASKWLRGEENQAGIVGRPESSPQSWGLGVRGGGDSKVPLEV